MKNLNENEFILLKSKDDYSREHYKNSSLSLKTGFTGTAGEGICDYKNKITLFVDPRYHIQAELQTKGKNINIVKMSSQFNFVYYLKQFLPENSTLYIPESSVSYLFFEKLKSELKNIKIKPYSVSKDNSSIDNDHLPVFEVPLKIAGSSTDKKILKIKIDNFLVTSLEQISWILNLRSYKTFNTSVFRAKLFIKNKKSAVLFTDYKIPEVSNIVEIKPLIEFREFIKNTKNEIYIDKSSISLADFNLIETPVFIKENPVVKMASVKNKSEINHYIDSFKRLDLALYNFREKIKEGLSEFELNEIFEHELINAGASCTSFKTILAIGSNSSIIHYTENSKSKILKKGDIILLDCGGYYEGGYATDITRVFWCKDKKGADPLIKEIYTVVLKAQLNVYRSKLLWGFELHNMAERFLKKYKKDGFLFPHGLGHGIGIPVHQSPPVLTNKLKIKLKNGNVFTIEPGLYKEGNFGIRLENTVYLNKNEKISLSHFPYEEDLIDRQMLNKKELNWLDEWQTISKRYL